MNEVGTLTEGAAIRAFNPATGEPMEPAYRSLDPASTRRSVPPRLGSL